MRLTIWLPGILLLGFTMPAISQSSDYQDPKESYHSIVRSYRNQLDSIKENNIDTGREFREDIFRR